MHKHWRSILLLICLTVLLSSFLGCMAEPETKTKMPPKAGVEYKHGTKIIVHHLPAKDETNIYQQEFKLQPEVTVSNKKASEKHKIEFNNMATYKGKTPSFVSDNASFTIIHSTNSKSNWHFPPKTKLVILADGERIEMPVYSQSELTKDSPSDSEFYENLIIQPTFEMYSKIAKAKSVEFQLGTGNFKLADENILAFRDFIDYLTP